MVVTSSTYLPHRMRRGGGGVVLEFDCGGDGEEEGVGRGGGEAEDGEDGEWGWLFGRNKWV